MKSLSMEQLKMYAELREGDKVEISSGEIVEFVRAKQSKFIGIMNEKHYDIPMTMLVSVVEKVDLKAKEKDKKDILSQLVRGQWFYINQNGKAILFKFEGFEGNKVIGINPIGDIRTKIDMSFDINII